MPHRIKREEEIEKKTEERKRNLKNRQKFYRDRSIKTKIKMDNQAGDVEEERIATLNNRNFFLFIPVIIMVAVVLRISYEVFKSTSKLFCYYVFLTCLVIIKNPIVFTHC